MIYIIKKAKIDTPIDYYGPYIAKPAVTPML